MTQIDKVEAGRAEIAFRWVQKVADTFRDEHGKPTKTATDYRSYVRKLPSLILANGLAQALAFAFSKGKWTVKENGKEHALTMEETDPDRLESTRGDKDKFSAWTVLYRQIQEYLARHTVFSSLPRSQQTPADLIKSLVSVPSPQYRMVEQDVLAFCNWLRRFAEALIPQDSEE